ncbi:MAG: ATP-dependent DNA helicase [Blautia sp.]|nr:ATP-dependent DNA helicase [Blautia sp.]MDY5031584.1 ATP-dependent DNA helicase [Blautia sp.]
MEKPVVHISVRNLVEFILRSGDLDSRKTTADKEAMQKGSRIHRKIQRQMGSAYQAEVPLKYDTEFEDLIIQAEGRADGIFAEEGKTWIDEIKGTFQNLNHLEQPVEVHRAQAMCYAWYRAEQQGLESIGIQITYVNMDTEEIRRFREEISVSALSEWYRSLMEQYHRWVSYQQSWRKMRNASTEKLEFPFPYREGQRKMVSSVYHSISAGKQIFIQAPTGVGKTMSTVFPAVRSVGEEKADTIFYLTAKTITRTVAEEAFSILRKKGLKWKGITITAKEKLCVCDKVQCDPQHCPYAEGHFDRINDAVYELWTTQDCYDRETIRLQADKWRVCPFELCLDLAVWTDSVICDYNYVFDPNVHLKRFFADGVSGKYLFLIDEAHNLVERARSMYSASLCKEDVLQIRKMVKEENPRLKKALDKVNRQLLELKKQCDRYEVLDTPGVLPISVLQLQGELDRYLEEEISGEAPEEILDFYFQVRDFLNVCDLLDENYVIYSENGEDGRFRLKLFCVNPAVNLEKFLEKGISSVFFSATLLPMTYYRKLLSTRQDDYGIYVRSPFPQENRCILVGGDVSSRYTRRSYEEYRRIAEYLARCVWQRQGNYMAFFPSYKMLDDVYEIYEKEFSAAWVSCIRQTPSMSEREREEFLEEFTEDRGTLLGFCIMGGVFSEGIDLMGEKLIGAMIVGTGLPQVSNEREILKNYYDQRSENGFDYAYRFPGMNKVLQAAGRVIRTREDEGVILLLDERFRGRDYDSLFPAEWEDRRSCRMDSVESHLQHFWTERYKRR